LIKNIISRTLLRFASGLLLCAALAACETIDNSMPDSIRNIKYAEWNPWSTPKPFASKKIQPEKIPLLNITNTTSFRGVVPCGDCEAIELILTLRPDQVFFLRKEFNRLPKRRQERTQEIGGWQISDDGKEIILKRDNGNPQRLAILSNNQLDVLNAEGKSINNSNEYQLNRLESAMHLIDSAELSGLYFEDGARGYWLECQSGVTWPVARAGDYAQLSKKYNAMAKPDEKTTLLTDITGHLVERQDDSKTTSEYLVVDDFKQLRNHFDCEQP
jgi:hypothetical protein